MEMLSEESISNKNLAKLKAYFEAEQTPLEKFDRRKKLELFRCREHY